MSVETSLPCFPLGDDVDPTIHHYHNYNHEVLYQNKISQKIFGFSANNLENLTNMSLVSKKWKRLLEEESPEYTFPKLALTFPLSLSYSHNLLGNHFSLKESKKLPLISLAHLPNDSWSDEEVLPTLLPLFEKKETTTLLGQDKAGRWFYLIRIQGKVNRTRTDGIIILYNEEFLDTTWRVVSFLSKLPVFFFLAWDEEIDSNHQEDLNCLLKEEQIDKIGYLFEAADIKKRSFSLWKSQSTSALC